MTKFKFYLLKFKDGMFAVARKSRKDDYAVLSKEGDHWWHDRMNWHHGKYDTRGEAIDNFNKISIEEIEEISGGL